MTHSDMIAAIRAGGEAQIALAESLADLGELRADLTELRANARWDRERARMIGVVLAVSQHTRVPCLAGTHSRAVCLCRPVGSSWRPEVSIPQQRRPITAEIGAAGERARRSDRAVRPR